MEVKNKPLSVFSLIIYFHNIKKKRELHFQQVMDRLRAKFQGEHELIPTQQQLLINYPETTSFSKDIQDQLTVENLPAEADNLQKEDMQVKDEEKSIKVYNFNIEISEEKEADILTKLHSFEIKYGFTDKSLAIASMASLLNTNTKYLTHILKKYRGKGFTDYINQARIKYISDALYNNPTMLKYKISHLADLAGFASHSRFTLVFKKETGFSPSEFINRLNKEIVKARETL